MVGQCVCVCIPLFVSLLCSPQFCVFLCSFNFLYFLYVFPPDVATCYQLPASIDHTHLVPVSGLFRIFCFNWFCATFLLFPAAADICQPLSSCQREFATPVLFCFRICFPHICFPDDRRPTQRWLLPFLWPLSFLTAPGCHFQFIHLHPESKQPSSKSFSFTLKHLQRLCATFHLP